MTISFVNQAATGAGNPVGTYPGSLVAGNLLLAINPSEAEQLAQNTLTGWDLVSAAFASDGVTNAGPANCSYKRVATGSESGTFNMPYAPTTPAVNLPVVMQWHNDTGDPWDVASSVGSDIDGTGTTVDITAATTIDIAAGDVLVFSITGSDDLTLMTSEAVTVPGCTLSGLTMTYGVATTLASDISHDLGYVNVTAGSATGPVHFTGTGAFAGFSRAQASFIRLRAAPSTPGDPSGLDVTEHVTSLELDWSAASGSPTGYDVRIDGGTPVDVGNVLTYEFTGLDPATSYTLEVRAYNGGGDSGWSSIGGTTLDLPAPTGLTIIGSDEDSITLGWDTHAYADGFEVRIDGGTPEDVGLTTIHIFTGLDEETLYTLEVRAYLGALFSDWASIDATTEGPPPDAGAYTVTLKVGAHEWTITDADVLDPSDPVQVLAGFRVGWQLNESDPWPTQPQPVEGTVQFYALNVTELDDVAIGTPMYAVLEDDDGNLFATIHGRVGQVTASPRRHRGGLRMLYTVPCVDYTVDLAEASVTITEAWPAESAGDRFGRIVAIAATAGITLEAPADTDSAAFAALDAGTTTVGALVDDHLKQIAIPDAGGNLRYVVVPVMDGDGLLDHFECVLLPRAVPATSLPGTFAIVDGMLTLVFADPDANGIVDAGDVDLDTTWNRLKYRAANHVVVTGETVLAEASRPGPEVRLNLDTTLTDADAAQRMAELYLPDTDEALGWVADTFTLYAHRDQSAITPPWFADHREDPPVLDAYVMPIAITGIHPSINFGGTYAAYAGQLSTVTLTIDARRRILVDFALRRQLAFGEGDELASWEWAYDTFPTVAWEDIDPDLSWYEARLGKAN